MAKLVVVAMIKQTEFWIQSLINVGLKKDFSKMELKKKLECVIKIVLHVHGHLHNVQVVQISRLLILKVNAFNLQ